MENFSGYHSEWNLGSPGGWDYQRITQEIGREVWRKFFSPRLPDVHLDFDNPALYPVNGFVKMLVSAMQKRNGSNPGLIAVVAEKETLQDVVENRNLAARLDAIKGVSSALMAPDELELDSGRVTYKGNDVSVIFMDFNTDVLLALHRSYGLDPLLKAVSEGRVINPRGTEPINVKSMFEALTDPERNAPFEKESVLRTPWTRRFYERRTTGPSGEDISDLPMWTRANWERLVLKPERGYSGKGVAVGGVHHNVEDFIQTALLAKEHGPYIVQEKVPFDIWAEELPEAEGALKTYQTDFRCLFGADGLYGFLCRYGDVPTNVGCGGGVQPLAIVDESEGVARTTRILNETMAGLGADYLNEALEYQNALSIKNSFTYLLGPIKISLRPRLITHGQMKALEQYTRAVWKDCLTLERMWYEGELDDLTSIEDEELQIVRSQPWKGSDAIFAADGLFGFAG